MIAVTDSANDGLPCEPSPDPSSSNANTHMRVRRKGRTTEQCCKHKSHDDENCGGIVAVSMDIHIRNNETHNDDHEEPNA